MKQVCVYAACCASLLASPARGQDTTGFRPVTPEGHSAPINHLAFSRDGRLVVTAGADGTARVWDAGTGREIHAFRGHSTGINAAAFSPDGKHIATASDDGTIRTWEVASGRELARILAHRGGVLSVTYAADGRQIATSGRDSTARLWDSGSNAEIRVLRSESGPINDVDFSSDGRYLATAGWEGTARVWDLTFGREVQAFPNHAREVNRVEFSPDGRRLVTASGEEGVIRVWDLVSAQVVRAFQIPNVVLRSAAFCSDGERVLGAGNDGVVRLWNVASGEEIRSYPDAGERLGLARCSPTGDRVAWGGASGTAVIWDASSGATRARLRGYGVRTSGGAVAPGGRIAAVIRGDSSVHVWSVETGRHISTIRGHAGAITSLAFSPDGKLLVTGSLDRTARVWDVQTGVLKAELRGHRAMIFTVAYGPSGNSILTLGFDSTARIWDPGSGALVAELNSAGWTAAQFGQGGGAVISLSRDGVRTWNIRSGRMESHTPLEIARFAALSSDGRAVLIVAPDSTMRVHELPGGGALPPLAESPPAVSSVMFSNDRRYVLLTGLDGSIGVWECRTGRRLRSLAGGAGGIQRLLPLLDDRRVLVTRTDGTVTLWNYATGQELIRRYQIGASDWVAMTPDGRFEGTQDGISRLHFARGLETAPLEAFFDRYYSPHVTEDVMQERRPARARDIRRESARRPVVTLVSPSHGETLRRSELVEVRVEDKGGGVEDIRLYHNGSQVGSTASGLNVQRMLCPAGNTCFRIKLITGRNLLEATAFSTDRVEAERDSVVVQFTTTGTLPTLHILAFGINTYTNPRYSLNYGRADATALVLSLVAGAATIFQDRIVVDTLFDQAVTGQAMRERLAEVARRSKPEDVFVLFYAGHGIVSQVGDSTRFFLVPTDITQFTDSAQLANLGLSNAELYRLILEIPALKKLILIDACHSGEMLSAFTTRGAVEERAMAQLAHASGVFVMSATDSDQFAAEVTALGHGVFTYSLLRAMSDTAGGPKRERMVGEILSQAARLVPDLSMAHRTRAQYPMVYSKGQDFPLVIQ